MSQGVGQPDAASIAPNLLAGDRRTIARTISAIERGEMDVGALTQALKTHLGRAHIVGITGPPGAGKSTLVHAILGEALKRGARVGVIAVDPSSPVSGGAVLGDRVRMGEHGSHPDIFIRSVASRGHLGGLSQATGMMVDVLDAAGFDTIIIETVGAGQSEVAIMRVADTCVVACPPGLGDSVQAIKAGILEIADILVITKSELPGAEAAARDLQDMLHLRAPAPGRQWTVPVLRCCAPSGDGIAQLMDCIHQHAQLCGRAKRLQVNELTAGVNSGMDTRSLVMRLAERDPFVRLLGIHCIQAGKASASVSLVLTQQHLNFNGSCHGGVIFSLADTAFGLASNSYGKIAAGIDAHVTYQSAAGLGDRLVASAVEVSRSRKLAVYRVDVKRADDEVIASFTGTVYITSVNVAGTHPASLQETM